MTAPPLDALNNLRCACCGAPVWQFSAVQLQALEKHALAVPLRQQLTSATPCFCLPCWIEQSGHDDTLEKSALAFFASASAARQKG